MTPFRTALTTSAGCRSALVFGSKPVAGGRPLGVSMHDWDTERPYRPRKMSSSPSWLKAGLPAKTITIGKSKQSVFRERMRFLLWNFESGNTAVLDVILHASDRHRRNPGASEKAVGSAIPQCH